MSNFNKVREFHERFEQAAPDTVQHDIFNDLKTIKLRLALITEEFTELKDAIKARDMTEVLDGATDLLYVTYGLFLSFGLDADAAFALVHESNMTKLDDTEENAKESVVYLKEHKPEYSPSYRKSGDKWLLYDTITGKILKSKFYKEVDLKSLSL
jgi:predicted HAD superfamily Cof-like phosphohydrolase